MKNAGSKPPVITTEQGASTRNSNQPNSANALQRREDIRLTKMMLIIFVSFVVSFISYSSVLLTNTKLCINGFFGNKIDNHNICMYLSLGVLLAIDAC